MQTESLMSSETVVMALLSSDPLSPLTSAPFVTPKVSFVNVAAFAHLSKMDDTQVYQLFLSNKTTPNDTPVNMTGVLPDYHDFMDIFSKTELQSCSCTRRMVHSASELTSAV